MMRDDMVALLGKKQQYDDNKKEYCNGQIEHTEYSLKSLNQEIGDLEAAIIAANDYIAGLTDKIKTLGMEVKALDKAVAEATGTGRVGERRVKELLASDSAAKVLLNFAMNV